MYMDMVWAKYSLFMYLGPLAANGRAFLNEGHLADLGERVKVQGLRLRAQHGG